MSLYKQKSVLIISTKIVQKNCPILYQFFKNIVYSNFNIKTNLRGGEMSTPALRGGVQYFCKTFN